MSLSKLTTLGICCLGPAMLTLSVHLTPNLTKVLFSRVKLAPWVNLNTNEIFTVKSKTSSKRLFHEIWHADSMKDKINYWCWWWSGRMELRHSTIPEEQKIWLNHSATKALNKKEPKCSTPLSKTTVHWVFRSISLSSLCSCESSLSCENYPHMHTLELTQDQK